MSSASGTTILQDDGSVTLDEDGKELVSAGDSDCDCCEGEEVEYIEGPVDCPDDLPAMLQVINPGGIAGGGTCYTAEECTTEPAVEPILDLHPVLPCLWTHYRSNHGYTAENHCFMGTVMSYGSEGWDVELDSEGEEAGDGYAAWILTIITVQSGVAIRWYYIKRWTSDPDSPIGEYALLRIDTSDGTCTDAIAPASIVVVEYTE